MSERREQGAWGRNDLKQMLTLPRGSYDCMSHAVTTVRRRGRRLARNAQRPTAHDPLPRAAPGGPAGTLPCPCAGARTRATWRRDVTQADARFCPDRAAHALRVQFLSQSRKDCVTALLPALGVVVPELSVDIHVTPQGRCGKQVQKSLFTADT